MKKIQKLLSKLSFHRVEIYGCEELTVHNYAEGTEKEFRTKKQVCDYLKSIMEEYNRIDGIKADESY